MSWTRVIPGAPAVIVFHVGHDMRTYFPDASVWQLTKPVTDPEPFKYNDFKVQQILQGLPYVPPRKILIGYSAGGSGVRVNAHTLQPGDGAVVADGMYTDDPDSLDIWADIIEEAKSSEIAFAASGAKTKSSGGVAPADVLAKAQGLDPSEAHTVSNGWFLGITTLSQGTDSHIYEGSTRLLDVLAPRVANDLGIPYKVAPTAAPKDPSSTPAPPIAATASDLETPPTLKRAVVAGCVVAIAAGLIYAWDRA